MRTNEKLKKIIDYTSWAWKGCLLISDSCYYEEQ